MRNWRPSCASLAWPTSRPRAPRTHCRPKAALLHPKPRLSGDNAPSETTSRHQRPSCERLALQHGLTDRERQTLELLALGETVAAIARALDVSENTVKTYTKRVYRKLDVHSKQDIIDLCREG